MLKGTEAIVNFSFLGAPFPCPPLAIGLIIFSALNLAT